MAVVGSGDFQYERVPEWPNMPKYWEFGAASDGAVNSKDEVYIFSRGLHPLTIWDTDGNFISSWGEGTFSANPHGIYIAPNDNVWLVDRDYHIATEYTPGGEVLRTLGEKLAPSPSFQGAPFNMPSGLAIAPDGHMFVSDGYGGHRVHKFTADGELVKSWGKQGTGPGEFALLHNVWVDKNSRVYIADAKTTGCSSSMTKETSSRSGPTWLHLETSGFTTTSSTSSNRVAATVSASGRWTVSC